MILSIDTTSESGSIALTACEETIEEVPLYSPDGFGHVLFQHIAALLGRHAVAVRDLDCLAAASGPGSFTGVRVGLSAVKGLAEAAGKRVVAVSNLRALASFGSAQLRSPVIDARRGEVYAALYDSRLEVVIPEAVLKFEDWLKRLPVEGSELVSAIPITTELPVVIAPRELAVAIGRIAWMEFSAGRAADPAVIDANYVRRSDAEIFWKE
ncbi:MAG TPA: tRNA (adenosine(37)-N6)-threonylcarbamoyltransferase complex dimerization subunit type 1 TsaB [Bryobacteraceae bacterium]|nr:tRNA (adenosine(37)-N6)-threonylcarbamoyltransferase complex dimerization subunit type 1 TsaB [Bryobacteraceae bacterium]